LKKYEIAIKNLTKTIESNESICNKINAYDFRGYLYLIEGSFTESIYDFTQYINLSNKVNKYKKKII